MKPRKIVSSVDLTTDGLGDLAIEQLADETLSLVRRDHDGRQVASIAILSRELSTLADTLNLAIIELRSTLVSGRSPGPSRFGEDGRPAS